MSLLSQGTAPQQAKQKSSMLESIQTFFYAILLALVFRSLLFEPFHIPSGSMFSTLEVGDYIFVSKYSYGYSRYSFPFGIDLFEGRLAGRSPERGDVVVFRLPTDTKVDYIKRVIGLPGDIIRVHDGVVYVNGERIEQDRAGDYAVNERGVEKRIKRNVETLTNGRTYYTLDETAFGDVDFTDEYIVPERHYFMMGDNRDNSIDSRYGDQVGFVPEENLIGRAEMILFSINKDAQFEFWEFWKYPTMFRDGRFFQSLTENVPHG